MLKLPRKIKGLRGLPGLHGKRKKREWKPEYLSRDKTEFRLTSEQEDRLARALRSNTMARRVITLLKKYPYGTVPEMLVMDYLDARSIEYTYQVALFGGHRPGGLVPDFLLVKGGKYGALLVNGNYWHQQPEKDQAAKLQLMAGAWQGRRITTAVIVWESALIRDRDGTMDAAMAGIEVGQ